MTVGLSSLDKPCVLAFYARSRLLTSGVVNTLGEYRARASGELDPYFRTAKASISTLPMPPTTMTLTVWVLTLENFLLQMTWR